MATFPNRHLNQKAVYWSTPTNDGFGGFAWADPVQINCRWNGSTEVITNSKGREIVSRAKVQVSQDLEEEGRLFLGRLDGLSAAEKADPTALSDSFVIQRFDKAPTVKGNKFFRRAFL